MQKNKENLSPFLVEDSPLYVLNRFVALFVFTFLIRFFFIRKGFVNYSAAWEALNLNKKEILKVDKRIRDVHHLKLHSYGMHKELSLDFRLPPEMSVIEAHDIATAAGKAVMDALGVKTTVHVEPFK